MSTDSKHAVGLRVKKLREAKQWSQRELADAARTHKQYISRLEQQEYGPKGTHVGADLIYRLSCALDVSVGYLLGYEEEQPGEEVLVRHYRNSTAKSAILKVARAME